MNIEKLLKPRFEVIADYPKSTFKVGQILEGELIFCDPDGPKYSDYPHLFRKLPWWEKRERSEMPMYLKTTYFGRVEICKIADWNMISLRGRIDGSPCHCDLLLWTNDRMYQPATEEEYLNSLKES